MAGDLQYDMGRGGAGLVAPFVPVGQSLISPQFAMSVVQQRMLNAERARQYQLDLDKIAQTERIKDEQFQLQRDLQKNNIDAESDLRSAQAENQRAQAAYHQKMADTDLSAIKTQWQYNAQYAEQLGQYINEINSIPDSKDSPEWKAKKLLIDQHYSDLLGASSEARRWSTHFDTTGTQSSNAAAVAQQRVFNEFGNTLSHYGIGQDVADQLNSDITSGTNKVWGVNKDDQGNVVSRFAFLDPTSPPTKRRALSLSDGKKLQESGQTVPALTLDPGQIEALLDMNKSYKNAKLYGTDTGGAPPVSTNQSITPKRPQYNFNAATGNFDLIQSP